MEMTRDREVRRSYTWPVRTFINFNGEVSCAATIAEENECERMIAEAGDDGGRSLSRRRRQGDIDVLEMGLKDGAPDDASSISSPAHSPQRPPPLSDNRLLVPSSSTGAGGRDQPPSLSQLPEIGESMHCLEMTRDREVRRSYTWPVRTFINFNGEVSCAATVAEENECERMIAEAGDDGGRSLSRRRRQGDIHVLEMGLKNGAPDDASSISSPAYSPQPPPPLSENPLLVPSSLVGAGGRDQPPSLSQLPEGNEEQLSCIMESLSILTYLGAFGIIGVLMRYGLQVLFGPDGANVTNIHSPLYIDLPSNMVGCFFMGWVGVVFKRDISHFSEVLAIGLSTGLMGSITTFTAWIQEMVNLTTKGHWMRGFIGILLGMELAYMSLLVGIGTAELLKSKRASIHDQHKKRWPKFIHIPSTTHYQCHIYGLIIFFTIGGILWIGGLVLSNMDFISHHGTKLWFACVVGPFGVWIRWLLARLNGQGIGKQKHLKWLPVGTLLTNLIATCLMATLSLINLMVKEKNSNLLLGGLELGFLGCMSTVSTFVAEAYAMYQSSHPWRAFAYVLFTLVVAFILETLIYSIPVWVNGYS